MTKQELTKYIDCYGKDIYSFCLYLTKEHTNADDLYQDTWMTVFEHASSIDTEGNVKSFCLSVAIKLWNNRKRKFAWRTRIAPIQSYDTKNGLEYISGESPSPEEKVCEEESHRLVNKAVDELPQKLKMVVLLYYMEDVSVAQISHIMKIPQGTVKSRLYQARKILEKKLEEEIR